MTTLMQSFQHYKGSTHTLLFVAENSEARTELMAVYVSHGRHKVLVQPWARFREEVAWPDGVRRPRFVEIEGEALPASAATRARPLTDGESDRGAL